MLKQRFIAGLLLAAVSLPAFLLSGLPGALLFVLLAAGLLRELLREFAALATGLGPGCDAVPLQLFGILLTVAVAAPSVATASTGGEPPGWGGMVEIALLAAFVLVTGFRAMVAADLRQAVLRWLLTVAGLAILYGLLSFLARLYFIDGLEMRGRRLALFLVMVTKFGDIGAYALGMMTARRSGGNHKLWPKLSPKKSWEGLLGGWLASAAVALWLAGLAGVGWLTAILLALLLTVLGLFGDLLESALKRAAGSKDSGRIPGLGGVFDFVDSLLFNAPVFYLFVVLA